MKKIIILLLVLFPVTVFCMVRDSTNTNTDSTKSKRLEMRISFSPDYCFRKLKPDADSKWIADVRDTLEIPKFGYTVGFGFAYKINKKISVEAGVLFSDKGERTKKYILENVPSGQHATEYSFNFHNYYLDIPVKANYFILTGKLKLYVTAGVSVNVFLNQKITSITTFANSDKRTTSKNDQGFSRINLAYLGGVGIVYPINTKTTLNIEPIYSRSITSIINAPVKSYLYSMGINIRLCFNLPSCKK